MIKEYIVRYKLLGNNVENVIKAKDENDLEEQLSNIFEGLGIFKVKKIKFNVDLITGIESFAEYEYC